MWEILLVFCLGLALGIVIKNRVKIQKAVGILIEWSVYVLLFLLGIAVGLNRTLIENMGTIGFYGILISITGIVFSIAIGGWVYIQFFKKKNEE